jgi:RNA polymerase sigma-70 factor (ECF subfamily)
MADIRPWLEPEITALQSYARALTRDPATADDLVQDTLARAIERSDQFASGSHLRAWLHTITRSIFLNDCRRAKLTASIMRADGEGDRGSVAPNQEDRVAFMQTERVFARLSEEHREILYLVVIEGRSYREAAEALDVAVGTVRSRVARARMELRARLDRAPRNDG